MDNFQFKQLFNPEFYILLEFNGVKIGLFVVLFIIFAETGLLAGFFLPGDSLLFLSGIYSETLMQDISTGNSFVNLILLTALIALMGIFGNMVGYWFGKKSGDYLFKKEDNLLFKKKYLYQSKDFFDKYGNKAVVFARFLPIVRTFAPVIAGIAQMDRKKFMFYNIFGSAIWSTSLLFSGHYLHQFFLNQFGIDLKHYIEFIVVGIISVSTLPVLIKILSGRRSE
jgi:membrane-associated protein